jgi:hypothetical protein
MSAYGFQKVWLSFCEEYSNLSFYEIIYSFLKSFQKVLFRNFVRHSWAHSASANPQIFMINVQIANFYKILHNSGSQCVPHSLSRPYIWSATPNLTYMLSLSLYPIPLPYIWSAIPNLTYMLSTTLLKNELAIFPSPAGM